MASIVERSGSEFFILRILIIVSLMLLSACEPAVRNRPYGEIRLGKLVDLLGPENSIERAQILLRRDDRGWYAMSLLCTKDLSILQRRGDILASRYTPSTYDLSGNVLTGPAVKNLPYYKLYVDQGSPGSPRDTLYVEIGEEASSDWRLPVPTESSSNEPPSN